MGTNAKFGRRVRALRTERGLGLRRFARDVGISPTYLSKIERGEFPPPAEDKVVAIADALGQDRDELLALAGRIASDLEAVILKHPRELASFLRAAGSLSAAEIRALTRTAHAVAAASPKERERWSAEVAAGTPEYRMGGARDGIPSGPVELP
jgi:transcriptional regulator with XRE-family HTH domain